MAVYTSPEPDAFAAFFRNYRLGPVQSIEGIEEGVENSNFLVRAGQARYILTLFEKRVLPQELPFFVGLMQHLAGAGFPAPVPIAGQDGQMLRLLADKWAVLVSFLPGRPVTDPRPSGMYQVGQVLARMHEIARTYTAQRPNDLSAHSWPQLLQACRHAGAARTHEDPSKPSGSPRSADAGSETAWAAELEHAIAQICPIWPDDLPCGIIHADLFPDNLFFQGDQVTGMIDFYFACQDLLAYDVAIVLNAWCRGPEGQRIDALADALLAGYGSVRKLTPREHEALPILLAGAAIRFALTRLYDLLTTPPDAMVVVKDPAEYLYILRSSLAQVSAAGPRASLRGEVR